MTVQWLGNIATTTGAVKSGGQDGGGRVVLDIPDDAFARIVASLIDLRGVALRVTLEPVAHSVYGAREDDDGSRWNDDADGQALASVYGANDE